MNQQQWAAMTAATRLTREGRLAEATALIQRSLGILPGPEARTATSSTVAPAPSPHGGQPGGEAAAALLGGLELARAARSPRALLGPARQNRPIARIADLLRRVTRPAPDADRPAAAARSGGQFLQRSYTNGAGMRAYKLYIPTSYVGQEVPLIVMLHGGTQTATDFAAGTRMNELAERDTFLVAYPEQDRSANYGRYWNWFRSTDQHKGAGEPSLIAGITQQIMRTYALDDSRIYIAGLSAGGAMTAVLAATYPELYAAAGVHSGLPYGAAHDLPSAFAAMKGGSLSGTGSAVDGVPLIVFHGDQDRVVAPINADHLAHHALQRITKVAHSGPVPHEATTTSGRVPGGHAYTQTSYRDATGHTIVEHWTIHQAGHAWSGGSSHGSYTDPQGPDASAEFARFFHTHRKCP